MIIIDSDLEKKKNLLKPYKSRFVIFFKKNRHWWNIDHV